jgi:hypothetical protein
MSDSSAASSPIPDYFAMFQSMLNPAAANPGAVTPSMFAMLDPKEIERKIGELETVLTWLKGSVGMVELSLQTLKYQQSVLATLAEASQKAKPDAAPTAPDLDALAKSAAANNPAMWAWNMMQQSAAAASKPPTTVKKKTSGRKAK